MSVFYLLTEIKNQQASGYVDLFSTIDLLLRSVEAIDVTNNEYAAYNSQGRELSLWVDPVDGRVKVAQSAAASAENTVAELLRKYLLLHAGTKYAVPVERLQAAQTLTDLVSLVPSGLITGG